MNSYLWDKNILYKCRKDEQGRIEGLTRIVDFNKFIFPAIQAILIVVIFLTILGMWWSWGDRHIEKAFIQAEEYKVINGLQ